MLLIYFMSEIWTNGHGKFVQFHVYDILMTSEIFCYFAVVFILKFIILQKAESNLFSNITDLFYAPCKILIFFCLNRASNLIGVEIWFMLHFSK